MRALFRELRNFGRQYRAPVAFAAFILIYLVAPFDPTDFVRKMADHTLPSASANDALEQARKNFESNNLKEAQRGYLKLLEEEERGRASYLLGVATASQQLKQYGEAKRFYLKLAVHSITQAADAALYACDYEATRKIIEERIKEEERTARLHYLLGYAYHGLGKISAAEEHYEKVFHADKKDKSFYNVESTVWLNLGAIHAAHFRKSGEEEQANLAVKALEKGIRTAGQDQKDYTIQQIETGLQPFTDRPKGECGKISYVTEDLTPIAGRSEVTDLLAQFSSDQAA